MKTIAADFFRRGLIASGFGPIILAILYLILDHQDIIETLTVHQVCLGIFSLTFLAFIAGGMNVVYQIESLPLMIAIFIHGGILYISYLFTYLLNGWLKWGTTPIFVFSVIFILCYLAIWMIIYSITKKNTKKLNEMLKKTQDHISF